MGLALDEPRCNCRMSWLVGLAVVERYFPAKWM